MVSGPCVADMPLSASHLPGCQRAATLIFERCTLAGEPEDECNRRAAAARRYYVEAETAAGHLAVPGARPEDWLAAGQCRDCFQPSFNYRPLRLSIWFGVLVTVVAIAYALWVLVDAVVHAPYGSHPGEMGGCYERDETEYRSFIAAAKTPETTAVPRLR